MIRPGIKPGKSKTGNECQGRNLRDGVGQGAAPSTKLPTPHPPATKSQSCGIYTCWGLYRRTRTRMYKNLIHIELIGRMHLQLNITGKSNYAQFPKGQQQVREILVNPEQRVPYTSMFWHGVQMSISGYIYWQIMTLSLSIYLANYNHI